MARRESLLRQELLKLLDQPAVADGFRGAAARYTAHLEAGARLGGASAVRSIWRLSLRDIADSCTQRGTTSSPAPTVRLFYDKDQEAAFVELMIRWARRLATKELSASPTAGLRRTTHAS